MFYKNQKNSLVVILAYFLFKAIFLWTSRLFSVGLLLLNRSIVLFGLIARVHLQCVLDLKCVKTVILQLDFHFQ